MQCLVDVVRHSAFFQMDQIQRVAQQALDQHPDFPAPLRLHLARTCFIPEWILPATRQLVTMAFTDLTRDNAELIGINAFYLVVHARARIDHLRRTCALRPPNPVHHTTWCKGEGSCERAWKDAWFGAWDRPSIATLLIHPDRYVSGSNILTKLEYMNTGDMDISCHNLSVAKVIAGGDPARCAFTAFLPLCLGARYPHGYVV
ncbi:hypothetical protein SCP_0600620 [Sparassis crispa]|uniref:Uncharacterized protein n=1 Tax=Sparassis crispa TaxID=139825 RepID=A0A401GQU5_9APHY|nr:hypothetical protein SCP_0600620 [Sparassis crispa]GBE84084.1 hypothetical protein SCP_0600620 [Sparassis crispa]